MPPAASAEPITIAEVKRDGDVDFEKDILPIFRRNCLACHSATEAQSDLVLESPQTILKGGSEGPAVVAGKSAESLLLKLAAKQKEPHMPPPDNDVKAKPLTPQELGLIKLWIDQGAKGQLTAANTNIAWQPLPPGVNPIYAVAITPDGQYAAASRANQIFLYHVPSRREIGRLTDASLLERGIYKQPGVADLDLVQSLKFSPDGSLLASGGFRTVKLWQKPRVERRELTAQDVTTQPTAVSADGKLTVRAGEAGKVELVEPASGKVVKTLEHGGPVAGVAIRPDGKRIASVGGSVGKLWNAESGQLVAEMKGDIRATLKVGELTRAAALAKKHIELAKQDLEEANKRKTAEEDNQKKSAEALTKAEGEFKPKEEATKKAAEEKAAGERALAEATAVKAKADEGKKAADEAVAKADEALKSLKANLELVGKLNGEDAIAAKTAAEKATAEVEALRKLLDAGKQASEKAAQEAQTAFTQAEEKAKQLVQSHQKAVDEQTAAQRTLESAKRGAERAAEAVKKATEAIPGFKGIVKAREETSKQRDAELAAATTAAKNSEKPITGVAFSPNGALMATVGDDQLLHTWDAESGAAIEVYEGGPGLRSIAFTADGKAISVGANQTSAAWDFVSEWKLARTIGAPDDAATLVDRVTALDFSPDGKLLAVGGGEPSRSGEIKLFDISSGQLVRALKEPHSDTVNCVAFSPDGQQIASCAADRFMKLWNVADGNFVRAFEGHTHHVLGLSWRADGRVLVSSGADMVLKVWDARTGDQLRTAQNLFTKEVTSVHFVGDGEMALASGGDSKVRLVNTGNGNSQRDFSGQSEYMYCVVASADGKTIVAGGLDGTLRIWDAEGKELAKFSPPPQPTNQTAAK
jgi:WD40 repeat protein